MQKFLNAKPWVPVLKPWTSAGYRVNIMDPSGRAIVCQIPPSTSRSEAQTMEKANELARVPLMVEALTEIANYPKEALSAPALVMRGYAREALGFEP